MPTPCAKYNKVPETYLKCVGSITKKICLLKLHFKKFYARTVDGRAFLVTYFNSLWKNT
jgi:hypothetical protein